MPKNKKISAYRLLVFGYIIVPISAIISYKLVGQNTYVNGNTLFLLCIFSVLNISALIYFSNKKDPFTLLLCYVNLFYYSLRVLTLLIIPWSIALSRYNYDYNQINTSFLYIIVSNIFIYSGLLFGSSKKDNSKKQPILFKPTNVRKISIFLITIIVIKTFGVPFSVSIGHLFTVLIDVFSNIYFLVFLVIFFIIIHYKQLTIKKKIYLTIPVLLYVLLSSIIGSRSAPLTIFHFLLISIISIYQQIKISFRIILISIPIIIISFFMFIWSTSLREEGYTMDSKVNSSRFKAAKELNIANKSIDDSFFSSFTDRIGFLDYSVFIIENRNELKNIINIKYYFKSVVDNGITPGFNLFNTPRASHSIRYVYDGITKHPTHNDVQQDYHSDQFCIYGEFYVLFGKYFSMIALFLFAFFIKRIYNGITSPYYFDYMFRKALVLLIFFHLINSFGIDWHVIELIAFYITYHIFGSLFYRKKSHFEIARNL